MANTLTNLCLRSPQLPGQVPAVVNLRNYAITQLRNYTTRYATEICLNLVHYL